MCSHDMLYFKQLYTLTCKRSSAEHMQVDRFPECLYVGFTFEVIIWWFQFTNCKCQIQQKTHMHSEE